MIANSAETAKGNWVKRQPSEISFSFFFFFAKPKKSDVLFNFLLNLWGQQPGCYYTKTNANLNMIAMHSDLGFVFFFWKIMSLPKQDLKTIGLILFGSPFFFLLCCICNFCRCTDLVR